MKFRRLRQVEVLQGAVAVAAAVAFVVAAFLAVVTLSDRADCIARGGTMKPRPTGATRCVAYGVVVECEPVVDLSCVVEPRRGSR